MYEKERMKGTIFDEQGEMIVWEQLMDSYSEGSVDHEKKQKNKAKKGNK